MMVCVPSCNIDRPIYIWLMEIKLKDTRTSLHIIISRNLIAQQLKKE